MFITPYVSCDTCHMLHVTYHVTYHMSGVRCHTPGVQCGFTLVCPSLPFHLPVFLPYSILPPFLVFILSYMSLPCYSPSFNCPLSLSLISFQCLPNFVTPYFLSLEFHSPNFSPIFLFLNSSSSSLPPKCVFLNFLSHEFHFHNSLPEISSWVMMIFMFIPHRDQWENYPFF